MSESYVIGSPVVYYGVLIGLLAMIALVVWFCRRAAAGDMAAGFKGTPDEPSEYELEQAERQGRVFHPQRSWAQRVAAMDDGDLIEQRLELEAKTMRLEGAGRATSADYAIVIAKVGLVLDEQCRRRHLQV